MAACGGCMGLGAHKRWCMQRVGHIAAMYGILSERAEALADAVGGNDPVTANLLYSAAGRLLASAREYEVDFKESADV